MMMFSQRSAAIIGLALILGFAALGLLLKQAALQYKGLDRIVTVKGLAEREYPADTVIWPIEFSVAGNDMPEVVKELDTQRDAVAAFLALQGIDKAQVSFSAPAILDKKARQYGGEPTIAFRYLGSLTVTVYSHDVSIVRAAIASIGELAKQGIVFNSDRYANPIEYSFTSLNDVKPVMIEEATKNARQVAEKFARDSNSTLGKIKRASQGQFSITDRDSNTPHIKRVRVVSTISYYLSD
ncbi:SIMPL domain-containing protein [Vibrio sp. NTOU-M3]|uniref:SIMPL domain-containing protein n=1 Tax=Vibrio sp. NTOU-M3 TaxID=3234954 RepID=UPI00349F1C46